MKKPKNAYRLVLLERERRERITMLALDSLEWSRCKSWKRMLTGLLAERGEAEVLAVFPPAELRRTSLPFMPSAKAGWLPGGVLFQALYDLAEARGSRWVCSRFRRLEAPGRFSLVGSACESPSHHGAVVEQQQSNRNRRHRNRGTAS